MMVDSPVLPRVFVTLLLLGADLETHCPLLGPLEWLPLRLDDAERLLDEASQDERLQERISGVVRPFAQRSPPARGLLRRAARLQREPEEQRIGDSAPEKVEALGAGVREGQVAHRRVHAGPRQLPDALRRGAQGPAAEEEALRAPGTAARPGGGGVAVGARRADEVTLEIPVRSRRQEGDPSGMLVLSCAIHHPRVQGTRR